MFCLYIVQRNHGALDAFSHQVAGLDAKLNSLRTAIDFQHQITTSVLQDEVQGRLSQIHHELLKQQAASVEPYYST